LDGLQTIPLTFGDMKRSRLERIFFLLKRRALVKSVFRHLKHKLEKRQPKIIPEIKLSEFMPNGVEETILDSPNADHDGNVSQQELRAICKVIKHFKPANLFEIGTFEGHTTAHMAANAPKTSPVFTLDLPAQEINHTALRIKTSDSTFILKERSGQEFLSNKGLADKITQLYGDSASFDFTAYDNKMDFVFVVGSHSYEYAKNDTRIALKLLRNTRGIIIWHDYGWREVVRALNELYLEHPSMGLARHIKDTSLVIYNSNFNNSGPAK